MNKGIRIKLYVVVVTLPLKTIIKLVDEDKRKQIVAT